MNVNLKKKNPFETEQCCRLRILFIALILRLFTKKNLKILKSEMQRLSFSILCCLALHLVTQLVTQVALQFSTLNHQPITTS